jgi:hypothetical protein
MSIRQGFLFSRFKKFLPDLERWRMERLPGARAIHSQYDRAASTILKWLFLGLHDIQAVSSYAYVIPFIVSTSAIC